MTTNLCILQDDREHHLWYSCWRYGTCGNDISVTVCKIKSVHLILQGSHVLSTLLALPSQPNIHAVARKNLQTSFVNLNPILEADTSKWPSLIKDLAPRPDVFLSALGTTKGQAGSFEAQRKIDYELNLSLAQAAKESGIRVYVIVSSDAVSKNSLFPYGRMKAELEDAVKSLNFPYTIILKPGLLVGTRSDSRPAEAAIRGIAKGLGSISKALTDFWAQDADVVGKAAVAASIQCIEGKRDEGTWVLSQRDITRLGRTEWKNDGKP